MSRALRQVSSVLVVALLSAGGVGTVVEQRQGGQVRLLQANDVVASQHVRPGRGFHLAAPPGGYRLEGRSGDAHCRPRSVTLHPGPHRTWT